MSQRSAMQPIDLDQVIDSDQWALLAETRAAEYAGAQPYPHIQIDDFLPEGEARLAMEAFPEVKDAGWIHYVHVNERKHGLNKMDRIPMPLQRVIKALNTEAFAASLSRLTGIPNLMPDDSLEGGGLHQTQRGGYLNVHADFTVHPHKRHWRRRVNLLLFLNEGWEAEYKGALELWSRDMKRCERRILPILNRCVIFNTDEDSFHGVPERLACPEEVSRKSIALYYFTEEKRAPRKRATHYKARPGDGLRWLLIRADTHAVSFYTWLKGVLNLNDDFVSNLLSRLSRKK